MIPQTADVEKTIEPMPVEEIPAREGQAIDDMIATLQAQLTERYSQTTVLRDAHPKHYGLVKASFVVDPDCPAELRHGLYRVPGGRFDALIRFSSGHPIVNHDLVLDLRGIAIKLLDALPNGERGLLGDRDHDFVMATGEGFFGKDAVDFVTFPAASDKVRKVFWFFLRGLRFPGFCQLVAAQKIPRSPLDLEYFSQTPYRLGPHCVKYHVRPRAPWQPKRDRWYRWFGIRHLFALVVTPVGFASRRAVRRIPGFDALRKSLERDLATSPVTLEFLVQRWPDLSRLPVWAIENATRRWSAPWERVATIEVAQQNDIRSRDDDAEHISFNPWRALPEHQPLGSINRARLAIYRAMSAFRHQRNLPAGTQPYFAIEFSVVWRGRSSTGSWHASRPSE